MRGTLASGGLEPFTAMGGSQNGLLRFVSFSARVRSPLILAQGKFNFGRARRPKLRTLIIASGGLEPFFFKKL